MNWVKDIGAPTAWAGHMDYARDLVVEVKPSKILELGTHYGHSLFSFAQGVKDAGLDSTLYSVDTWEGDAHTGKYSDTVYQTVVEIKDKHFKDLDIRLYKKSFDSAKSMFKAGSIDLLHIDGAHDYKSVKNDVDNYLKKVKPGGVILMHDIDVPHFGVRKVYEEIKEEHPEWSYSERSTSFGLGVIKTNEQNIQATQVSKKVSPK